MRETGGMYTHSALLKRMHESKEVFKQIIATLEDNGSITSDIVATTGKKTQVCYYLKT